MPRYLSNMCIVHLQRIEEKEEIKTSGEKEEGRIARRDRSRAVCQTSNSIE